MTVVALEAADVAVEVTTDCMPPTSFLVERAADPTDRRAVVLRATEAGRRVQREVATARAADSAELFARLTAADRTELGRILRTLAD